MLDRTRLTCVFNISSVDDLFEIFCTPVTVEQREPQVERAVA